MAIVSRKLFCGASKPLRAGILAAGRCVSVGAVYCQCARCLARAHGVAAAARAPVLYYWPTGAVLSTTNLCRSHSAQLLRRRLPFFCDVLSMLTTQILVKLQYCMISSIIHGHESLTWKTLGYIMMLFIFVNAINSNSISVLNGVRFIRRFFTARRYASAVYAVVVCPSVCPSVTSWYCVTTAKHRITQTTSHYNAGSLVFWHQRSPRNSKGVSGNRGYYIRQGVWNLQFLTHISHILKSIYLQ